MTDAAHSLSPLIHLVDDDAAVREGLSLLISTVGLRVQAWADPQSFMAGFDRASIGAIVLDVRMPGISGLTVLEQLLAQRVDQPVVLLTGHGTVEMSPRTVETHRANLFAKLGAESLAQLIRRYAALVDAAS
jgi:FixJ family two-component response regulator